MLRVIGVLLIFSACCCTGINMSLKMRKKLERLELFRRMTDETATLIRYRGLTVREIMTQLRSNAAYTGLDFLQSGDYSDRSHPAAEIFMECTREDMCLSAEEKRFLIRFASELGTSDVKGQLSAISILSEELDVMIKAQSEKYAVKGRLCRSMGILAGAMLGILII